MIPLTLQIKNFLSYGPELQTIQFGPYPLICLSGKNGHGKSALLDAITWALWGQARKTLSSVKPDQGLLRLGQTHMLVIFDFQLGETHYRVRREFSYVYGKHTTHLEFGILNPTTQALIPLTNKTIRATQETIEKAIHIDFDSFTNSAFLRQGNANEFSKKSSKDRKEILAAILGLGQYEILRKRALEKTRMASAEKQALITVQEKLVHELAKKDSLSQQLQHITEQLASLYTIEQTVESSTQHLEKTEKEISNQQNTASLMWYTIQALTKQQREAQRSLQEKYKTWRTVHKKQLHMPDYGALLARKKALTYTLDLFQQKLHLQLDLQKKHLTYTSQLQHHTQQVTLAHAQQENAIHIEIEGISTALKSTTEHSSYLHEQQQILEKEIAQYYTLAASFSSPELTIINTQLAAIELLFERRKEYYHHFRTRGSMIQNALQNNTQKQQFVNHKQDPCCPLCEQPLSNAQRHFLEQKFTHSQQVLTHQRTRLINVLKKLKSLLMTQHEQLTHLRTAAQEQITLMAQQEELAKTLKKAQQAHKNLCQQQTMVAQKERTLCLALTTAQQRYTVLNASKASLFAHDERHKELTTALCTVTTELDNLSYNETEHRQTQLYIQEIEQQLLDYEHIQHECAQQHERKKDIKHLCHTLRDLKKQITEHTTTHALYHDLPLRLATLMQNKKELSDQRRQCAQKKEYIIQEKGSIIAQQEKMLLLEKEYLANQNTLNTYDTTIADYNAIAIATGRDGIQALLIEDAIPEIEHEANNLLKKLTNNQTHIFIESLRDLKKGGTKETLDINISDATGIRPYELFSGGEAFRIDFALRIAISKLLARRAGTALQTLIIDEGFGSQDEEGLTHIMDVLHVIQNDFSKVIIVSHLNAMKNQFPVHFVVEKNSQGSVVSVIEQD